MHRSGSRDYMNRSSSGGFGRSRRGGFAPSERTSADRSSHLGGSVIRRSNRNVVSSATTDANNRSALPHIGYKLLSDMLKKEPDQLIIDLTRDYFQLDKYLSDDRMKNNYDWLEMLTTLFERILGCLGQEKRIADILIKLPDSVYFDALYDEIRKNDQKTGTLRFKLILQTLKIIDRLLTINPHAENAVSRFTERIGTYINRLKDENEEIKLIKQLHATVGQKAEYIYQQVQEKAQVKNSYIELRPPPDNFHLLSLIPTMNEILSQESVYLRPNLVEQGGSYDNSDHYLDIHFRLLREDFLGPLRDGIQTYRSKSSIKNTDVRVYENVYSLGPKLSGRVGMVYGLRLDEKKFRKIQWTNSRRLIYGSLLAITADNFQTATFVTVEDRSNLEKDLTLYVRPYIESNELFVNHDFTKFDLLLNCQFLTMVETTSYFEAYRHVLHALQKISSEQFPLAPYILHLSHDITPPNYVTATTQFDFTPLLVSKNARVTSITQLKVKQNSPDLTNEQTMFRISYEQPNMISRQHRNVTLVNDDEWPRCEELQLNQKQYEALKLALTKKVALIQGPPGTGKTFLGVKIAELLLHNRSVWCPLGTENAPILMVCQTNHALDQFLEHIISRLNMKDGLMRVGGRCKNEKILPFSLATIRQRYRREHLIPSIIHYQKRDIINKKTSSESTIQSNETIIDASHSYLTSIDLLFEQKIIKMEHYLTLIGGSGQYRSTNAILNEWLGLDGKVAVIDSIENEFDQLNFDENRGDIEEGDNEEQDEEERRRDEIDQDEDFFGSKRISTKIQLVSNIGGGDNDDGWRRVVNKEKQKKIIQKLLNSPTTLNDEYVDNLRIDLWLLPVTQRQNLYRYWLTKYREKCYKSVSNAHLEFNQAVAAHSQYMQLEDYYILKNAIIVAMTTTCAAKYFDVIQKLACKIVIVEEAAEIFEAHVITSLSPKCEHLILIGDHVQLRPSPSVYKLAVNYKIDVSLFERFVKNDFPNVRLNIQHRMRPEICQLMLHFYGNLENHESVFNERPSITGVQKNLFFISHTHPEEAVTEGNSKQNIFEAQYILALAEFLVKQGYEKSKITILVMYLGQRALISRMMKTSSSSKFLQGIRINVTDSYQGEENEIILLSLVRSANQSNTIGFLKIHNRICVALSRARCAMYIVGNLNFLMQHEDMWKKIADTLLKNNAVGKGLPLCCKQHPDDNNFIADTVESFKKRPEGGCDKLCDSRLRCGHSCQKYCHNYSHDRVQCTKLCNATLTTCEHRCAKLCHYDNPNDHGICREPVEKTVQPCNHTIFMACSIEPTSDKCTYMVPVRLPCDHLVDVTCAIRTKGEFDKVSCPTSCEDTLLCSHQCSRTCGECKAGQLHLSCAEQCGRQLLCTHLCQAPCASNCPSCSLPCDTVCSHSKCPSICGELCSPCREPCSNACEHEQCSRLCSEPCDRKPCQMPCLKTNPKCGDPCIGICGEPCPPQCRTCNKQLVQEYFFGNEDKPNSRFVYLPDCNHLFEMTGLDRYMNNFLNNLTNSSQPIRYPKCPRCPKPIRHCQRYTSLINQIQSWIEEIKLQQQNGLTKSDITEQFDELFKKMRSTMETIQIIEQKHSITLIRRFENKKSSINIDELNYMKNTCEFFDEINRLLSDGRNKLNNDIFTQTIEPHLRHLLVYIYKQCNERNARNYAQQQLHDIQNELRRIRCLINYHILKTSVSYRGIFKIDHWNEMKMLTNKSGPFTKEDHQRFEQLVAQEIKSNKYLSSSTLLEEKSLSIVDTIKMETGHWFTCRNNHIYNIDQMNGDIKYNKCPLCASKPPLDSFND